MRSRQIPLVSLDLPELPDMRLLIDVVTSPLVYVRLHSRNKEEWNFNEYSGHNYLYTDKELEV